jgi:hypothetical protein
VILDHCDLPQAEVQELQQRVYKEFCGGATRSREHITGMGTIAACAVEKWDSDSDSDESDARTTQSRQRCTLNSRA